MLLLFYDKNKRGELDYDDFTNMILSTHSTSKRVMRSNCNFNNSDVINLNGNTNDKESNILLMKCIGKELQLAKDVMNIIDFIKRQYDYNIDQLYFVLSETHSYNITKESLGRFLNILNRFHDHEDIEAILHRLDINKDSIVNYNDFSALFSLSLCHQYHSSSALNISMHSSKLNDKHSFVQQISPSLILRKAPSNYCHCGLDGDYKEYTESVEDKFIEYFKLLIEKEKVIEKAKIDLMIRPDFNINDAFRLFNSSSNKGYLFISDLELFFYKINNSLNRYELNLINKRCDLRHKGYISYADFFDLLVPFEKEYRTIIEERNIEAKGIIINFSEGTIILLIKLISIIIEAEKLINGFRMQLREDKKYLIDLFRSICQKNIEMFTIDELISFFKQKGVLANEIEISLLYIRLDRNRTGEIELFELDDEFTYIFSFN